MNKYDNRCLLCAVIYGAFGALGCIMLNAINNFFTDIIKIVIYVMMITTLIVNVAFIIHIKSLSSIIKVIFREIKIVLISLIVFFLLELAVFEIAADISHIFINQQSTWREK